MSNEVILGLGTNVGDKISNLENAISLIQNEVGTLKRYSKLIETKPWGKIDQDDFLNKVIVIETNLFPLELLKKIKEIEIKIGRVKTQKWGERVIDIDILFYENYIFQTPNLIIPHPFIQSRKFVLESLNELFPDKIHPKTGKSIQELMHDCKD